MEEKLKDYAMLNGFIAVKPAVKGDLAPETGRFTIHTFGTVLLSSKSEEVGLEVIYDGTKAISLEDSDIEVIPEDAILAIKGGVNG